MIVKFLSPRLGYKAGAVVDIKNLGVAKTLISLGHVEEHKEVNDGLDSDKDSITPKPASKRKRSKGSSKRSAG